MIGEICTSTKALKIAQMEIKKDNPDGGQKESTGVKAFAS